MDPPTFVNFPEEDKHASKFDRTFDEAAELSGTGKFHNILFMICGLCTLTLMTATLSIGLYVMFVKCDMEISVYEQGLLASMAYLGIVVSSHTWGFLSDTWGRLKIIRISIIGAVALGILSAFSYTSWMLIALKFLVGVFICGTQSSIFSYLGEFHSAKTKTKSVTYLSTFLSAGMMFLPALALVILPLEFDGMLYGKPFSSWRMFEIISSIPGIIAAVGLLFMPESPKYLFSKGDHEACIDTLRRIYHLNSGNPKEMFPVEKFSDSEKSGNLKQVDSIKSALLLVWNQTTPMFQQKRIGVSLILLILIFVSYFVAHGVYMWFPEMLTAMVRHIDTDMTVCEMMQYELNLAANTTSQSIGNLGCVSYVDTPTYIAMIIMGGAYTIVYFSAGFLIKTVGKKRLLIVWFLVGGTCGIALLWSRNFYFTMFLFIGFLVVGVCGGIISTISVDFYPTSISAMAMCLIMMVGRLGVVAGSNSVGIILDTNCESIFYGLGSLILSLALLALPLPSDLTEKKGLDS